MTTAVRIDPTSRNGMLALVAASGIETGPCYVPPMERSRRSTPPIASSYQTLRRRRDVQFGRAAIWRNKFFLEAALRKLGSGPLQLEALDRSTLGGEALRNDESCTMAGCSVAAAV